MTRNVCNQRGVRGPGAIALPPKKIDMATQKIDMAIQRAPEGFERSLGSRRGAPDRSNKTLST